MGKFEIKKGWMSIVWKLDDGIVLKMTVGELKEVLSEVSDSFENE